LRHGVDARHAVLKLNQPDRPA